MNCSFCGSSKNEVNTLIAGPNVYICDACTVVCLEILIQEKRLSLGFTPSKASLKAEMPPRPAAHEVKGDE